MKQLIIFDLDGTLLNTLADLAQSCNYALRQLGYPVHGVEAYKKFVGNGVHKLLERALPAQVRCEAEVSRLRAVFGPHYDAHSMDFTAPYPGIKELLAELARRGMKFAVASNKYQRATVPLVAHYFTDIHFEAVLGQREGIPVKPNPQIILDILQVTKTPKEAVLYVGDSDVDMQTAANAGVAACAVTWGFRAREELEKFHPAHTAAQPPDILQMLE